MRLGATCDGMPNYFIRAITGIRLVGLSQRTALFSQIRSMEKLFQSRSTAKAGDTQSGIPTVPIWQLVLLLWCFCAIAFFAVRLAEVI
jgi:hypothetical protein